MNNKLQKIVDHKRQEIKELYEQYDLSNLRNNIQPSPINFYEQVEQTVARNDFFTITEFKRKSPSAGWINQFANIQQQVQGYADLGASGVSVLTDSRFFGGSFDDLRAAAAVLKDTNICLLQKDFILDEIQVYLARQNGANIILLIAAILTRTEIIGLKALAESLNMGVLMEVHTPEECAKIEGLNCTVIGINNRDLTTFNIGVNRCNYLAKFIPENTYLIAESGVSNWIDFKVAATNADGFLIGTSLMQHQLKVKSLKQLELPHLFLKACGLRTLDTVRADLIGINFSPISKRKISPSILKELPITSKTVGVFRNNSEAEILEIAEKHELPYLQLYADEVSVEFVRNLKQKVILGIAIHSTADLELAEAFAPYVDLFILDGGKPGSGELIDSPIPADFPYPFLLAGGINYNNLDRCLAYQNCIGVDIASGIETNGMLDPYKVKKIRRRLQELRKTEALAVA